MCVRVGKEFRIEEKFLDGLLVGLGLGVVLRLVELVADGIETGGGSGTEGGVGVLQRVRGEVSKG